jgi:AbrB family looped-hinge helix DNA binding protein
MSVQNEKKKVLKPNVKMANIKEHWQVTIPEPIRKELGLRIGDWLKIVMKNRKIVMIPQRLIDKNSKKMIIRKVFLQSD